MKIRTALVTLALFVTAIGVTWNIATDVARQDSTEYSSPPSASDRETASDETADDREPLDIPWELVYLFGIFVVGPVLLRFVDALKVKWSQGPPPEAPSGS